MRPEGSPAISPSCRSICEEFLGLQPIDAFWALLGAKYQKQVVDYLIEQKAAAPNSFTFVSPDDGG
jgi:hypothetical protein